MSSKADRQCHFRIFSCPAPRRVSLTDSALIPTAYPDIDPTMADSLTVRGTLTVVPGTFRSTTLVNVTIALRADGLRARMPGGDSSIDGPRDFAPDLWSHRVRRRWHHDV
jgi:hypothetical protein